MTVGSLATSREASDEKNTYMMCVHAKRLARVILGLSTKVRYVRPSSAALHLFSSSRLHISRTRSGTGSFVLIQRRPIHPRPTCLISRLLNSKVSKVIKRRNTEREAEIQYIVTTVDTKMVNAEPREGNAQYPFQQGSM